MGTTQMPVLTQTAFILQLCRVLLCWCLESCLQLWTSRLQKDIAELEKGTNGKWDGASSVPVRWLPLERERQRRGRIQPRCEQEVAAHDL